MPPQVATLDPVHLVAASLHHQNGSDGGLAIVQCLVNCGLQGKNGPFPVSTIGGDDHGGLGIINSCAKTFCTEPSEHHRVDGPQASHRQHGDDRLRNEGHIDDDSVALTQPQTGQEIGGFLDLRGELRIGERAGVTGFPLEMQGNSVATPFEDMAIETVVGHVQLTISEPLREGWIRPIENLSEGFMPVEKLA